MPDENLKDNDSKLAFPFLLTHGDRRMRPRTSPPLRPTYPRPASSLSKLL